MTHVKHAYRHAFSPDACSKASGFTLLELVITLVVLSVLVTAAAPSFSQIIESSKMKRLATELEWLMVQAKSEAVMRNQEVTLHMIDIGDEDKPNITSDWQIEVRDASGGMISYLDGNHFKNIEIYQNFPNEKLIFDSLYGKPKAHGSLYFNFPNKQKLRTTIFNRTGRVYSCSYNAKGYGYERC